MSDDAPGGFASADLGPGFGGGFGPVWLNRARQRLGFHVAEHHANATGVCHGGALATFADAQLIAIQAGPEEGEPHTPTINLELSFLAPARVGSWVEAEVTLLRRTHSLLFTQATITADGEPVARAAAIYRNRHKSGDDR